MATPYTAYVTPTTPDVIEYTIILEHNDFADRKINAIDAVRTLANAWSNTNKYYGGHPLSGSRGPKDFVEQIMAAAAAADCSFVVVMPKTDENIHEALIATALCHLRVPFTLKRKT